ncbi:MAG: hypothetical protein E6I65_07455 [Chloroflexi bacterium]|nr:MAG: hypothetical protein E6I65_07455 [Chloroflexota bacterium]
MTPRRYRLLPRAYLAARALGLVFALALAACSPGQSQTTLGPRPSSPAHVEIVQPTPSSTLTGTTVHIVLKLAGATIVSQTTTAIKPDEGHVHLYVDNVLVSMNYGLEQDITVPAGTHVLKAEFVAADHAPFDPRVWSTETIFTVRT